MTRQTVFTVGHSNSTIDHVLSLMHRHSIRTVIDIRTKPGSGHVPQFNRAALENRLPLEGMAYRFRGEELGGHPEDPFMYLPDRRVNFALVREEPGFQRAVAALAAGEMGAAPVLFCKEADALKCPRFFLIGRILSAQGVEVVHIDHADGGLETHREGELRMLVETEEGDPDLFLSDDERLERGYRALEQRYEHRLAR